MFLNFGKPEIIILNTPKNQTWSIPLDNANWIANREDPDQTAPPLGAVWSGSALFALTHLSESLRVITILVSVSPAP